MNAHQVITGALNNGENVYALGNIEGLTFTACAVGSDVVILDSDFNRVQIIPESKNHLIVSSLSCCQETGKIAVTYGNLVKILEATNSGVDKTKLKSLIFQFTWVETYSFSHKEPISSVQWSMEGLRILFVIGNKLVLHQHRSVSSTSRSSTSAPVTFCISDDDLQERHTWEVIWTTVLPYKPKFIRYSPDGFYLALSGDRDCFIKIFYQNGTEHSELDFCAITLNHPAPVCGFEWRKTGRYMPRKCISPILLSWCEDRTSRIWKETPAPETSIIDLTGEGGGDPLWDRQKAKKFLGKYIRVKKTKTKILNKLRKIMPEKHTETDSNPIGLRAQIGKSPSLLEFPSSKETSEQMEIQFYLAATINAETDCLLVPSFNESNNQKPFCVHWLNNKELVFSVGAEKLLAEAVLLDLDAVVNTSNDSDEPSPEPEHKPEIEQEQTQSENQGGAARAAGSINSDTPSSKDILDVKLEILLRQWTKSNDVLFSVHPVDGSLLTWTVEWLDDHFRQPVISYSSRLPGALPCSDSMSLQSKLNTFNPHEPIYLDALRNDSENKDTSMMIHDKLMERRVSNTIHVLTSHDNGTLNLWHMSVDDQSSFSHVVSMTHISRMCGHRFQMQQIIAHPVLPLLLTTSKFKSSKANHDSAMDVLSEVILWKITPVGPLCKNGGVKELARVASPLITGFSSVGWVPAILPSCTLGTVCNSPSSCFISCDGSQLIIYQAVLDARGLLSELSNAKTAYNNRTDPVDNYSDKILRTPSPRSDRAPSFLKQFNVVSTQSTAKPGCVLEVGRIEDVNLNDLNLMFLHVFQSRIVLADDEDASEISPMSSVIDRSQNPTFRDKFFIVIVDQKENEDVIMMFSLTISSQTPQSIPNFDTEVLPGEKGFLRPSSPLAPSMAKLSFEAELVCRQVIPLPEGTRITNVVPAAGHLSSSSLYPACETPYVLVSSDDDDSVRFWRCVKVTDPVSPNKYEWREWNMISENHPSELGLEGAIVKVNAAHSGRIACAYKRPNTTSDSNISIEVAVFECESSGGVEWFREDSFSIQQNHFYAFSKPHFNDSQNKRLSSGEQEHLNLLQHRINAGKPAKPSYELIRAIENSSPSVTDIAQMKLENIVRLDWVSTEDGTHMLTVGMGTKVYIYAQIGQDPAQQNVTLMRESETSMRRPSIRKASSLLPNIQPNSRFTSWICCRVLNLDTADGLPPIPTALSWVRDGILIVGMQSEMRVYNQWNFKNVEEKMKNQIPAANPNIVSLTVSTSHSMLDQLTRKKEALVSSRSRVFLEFVNTMHKAHPKETESQMVLDILKSEGVFETARMCSPILPQYHPKQLIVLLNAGKKRRVKAILNHVLTSLKQRKGAAHNPLSRAASIKRMSTVDRGNSVQAMPSDARMDDDSMDYDEIDDIPLLPLYALFEADYDSNVVMDKPEELVVKNTDEYDDLFDNGYDKDSDIDAILKDSDSVYSGRSRHLSGGSDTGRNDNPVAATFTAKDYRKLTELLTHTHLPGLSSVDQMHLLAIADTLSHFASDAQDKVEQANAAMKPVVPSVLGDNAAGGYATAAAGVETVDECGLRYLMAMKQHEYLLVCLPMKQRMELKKNGLSAANIIWAQHSETETELLNAVPGMHKTSPSWDELKGLGVAWWLKNTASLKICIEKIAKASFQQNQDPLDASLFYLALRKKNVLTHLFKTVRNQTMADFFMNDFNSEHWQKVAAKNAFVLMSKQRFLHAAAFFLLSGSLKDAVQTLCNKCNDIQLALVIVRMYESDPEAQQAMINEVLCREVLGITYEEFEQQRGRTDDDIRVSVHASKEPFERSMAYWMLKDYIRSAHTLVQEAQSDRLLTSLSDIFNFYSYLRKHPLVVRQRLSQIGAQVGTTEKLLALGRQLESVLTPPERRLFFRTSAEHMARGCPMLSLDVLTMLPKQISIVQDYDEALRVIFGANQEQAPPPPPPVEVDWSKPTTSDEPDELKLDWSDEEEGSGEDEGDKAIEEKQSDIRPNQMGVGMENSSVVQSQLIGSTDILAQHMKFVASLRILTEELSTLASGFDVDGGQLRNQLLNWLEREVEVLQTNCDYNADRKLVAQDDNHDSDYWSSTGPNPDQHNDAAKLSRASPTFTTKRRLWLKANQKLLRSFTSFCTLHSAHNHRLASVLMELLLLLLNVQRDAEDDILPKQLMAAGVNTFPLLDAAVSSPKMFVSSPLAYIENQGYDLLAAINELTTVPNMAVDLQKCYMLYNLCQGFSCCIYLSLTDIDQVYSSMLNLASKPAPVGGSENHVVTPPVKWPGVEALVALLGREKEDDAPQLRLLIIESFLAISMSLFCFALSAYDSRWLYRLSAHEIDPNKFGLIFGGGGEVKKSANPPARPPRPAAPIISKESTTESNGDNLRCRLNLRILGNEKFSTTSKDSLTSDQSYSKWVPPQKNIVQLFAEKPNVMIHEDDDAAYESDEEDGKGNTYSDDEDDEDNLGCENAAPSSFAWQLLRLALIQQQLHRVKQFLVLVGFDPRDIPTIAPRIESVLQLLSSWISQQHQTLKNFPGGIPNDILPDMTIDMSDQHLAASMKKYAVLVKKNNTPFESDDKKIQSIQRLWSFLVREDHLQEIFIKYIFSQHSTMESAPEPVDMFMGIDNNPNLPEAFKIVQKDSEPIVAFGCNQESPGLIVVSNGRELQEMDMSNVFKDQYDQTSWMWNRADLDMKNIHSKRDALRDNDDYQIFTDSNAQNVKHTNVMIKRHIPGVRRIDSHPHAPFYVTGSSDGSIKVWKWGAKDTVYTARIAGQHAKVAKIAFSCNGNKFAAVDGDGMLCLWQASQATEQKKPFFSQRCHNKSATDVCFLGHSASVLLTAGSSSLDYNLGLWDTLLPTNRALVHSWVAHPEGATCALYVPNQQTIFSGGRHGEICLWDIRQRQLRHTIKAFDQMHVVKTLATDSAQDLIVSGSSEGDIKIWSADANPQLMYNLPGEHTAKGGFSFRQVGQSSVQGVQQLFIDQNMRLFSCGADASLKFRTLPSIFNMTNFL